MLAGSASKSFIGFAALFYIIAQFFCFYFFNFFLAMIKNMFNEFLGFDYYAMFIFQN